MELIVVQSCCFLLWGMTFCIPLYGFFVELYKFSTIAMFLVNICKNRIGVFLIHHWSRFAMFVICSILFWWSPFFWTFAHIAVVFSTEKRTWWRFTYRNCHQHLAQVEGAREVPLCAFCNWMVRWDPHRTPNATPGLRSRSRESRWWNLRSWDFCH